MNRDYLFVYGTLRKDYKLELMKDLADHLVFAGKGTVHATLYDLGAYPAALPGESRQTVTGDVFEVINGEMLFPVLDEYEGEEYIRRKTVIKMETGKEIETWVYWYAGPIDESLRIRENDYLDYLKHKKTV